MFCTNDANATFSPSLIDPSCCTVQFSDDCQQVAFQCPTVVARSEHCLTVANIKKNQEIERIEMIITPHRALTSIAVSNLLYVGDRSGSLTMHSLNGMIQTSYQEQCEVVDVDASTSVFGCVTLKRGRVFDAEKLCSLSSVDADNLAGIQFCDEAWGLVTMWSLDGKIMSWDLRSNSITSFCATEQEIVCCNFIKNLGWHAICNDCSSLWVDKRLLKSVVVSAPSNARTARARSVYCESTIFSSVGCELRSFSPSKCLKEMHFSAHSQIIGLGIFNDNLILGVK